MNRKIILAAAAAAMALMPETAFAHPGHDGGLVQGFLHPMSGADHLLALLVLGFYASQLDTRRSTPTLASFLAAFAAGAVLGSAGVGLPFMEAMLAVSLVALGSLVLVGRRVPVQAAVPVLSVFALFHGAAHGSELAGTGALVTAVGFLASSALLAGAGLAAGRLTANFAHHTRRVAAGASMAAGVLLLAAG